MQDSQMGEGIPAALEPAALSIETTQEQEPASSAVRVAVRVRPFSQKERDAKAMCIVSMKGAQTFITNPSFYAIDPVSGQSFESQDGDRSVWERGFTFDHSYWSHRKSDDTFAPQADLYDDIGAEVVKNALVGYNCTLFAYGQTGSGKTYTMMGPDGGTKANVPEEEYGLIPRIVSHLFKHLGGLNPAPSSIMSPIRERSASAAVPITDFCATCVEAAYLEVYNEQVRDLLAPELDESQRLKVREHPTKGTYVEGLTREKVLCYADVEALLQHGGSSRAIASHQLNEYSSRSHAVFTLWVSTIDQDDRTNERTSKLSLVDLAGSERAKSTGCTGDRLREASNINRSLLTLGEVIKGLSRKSRATLARSTGVTEESHFVIPYRNSVLTWLLKDDLGGNSRAFMVATISPCASSYSESMSTLRYAERAKTIVTVVMVNDQNSNPVVVLLRAEVEQLKEQLQLQHTESLRERRRVEEAGQMIKSGEVEAKCAVTRAQRELRQLRAKCAGLQKDVTQLERQLRHEKLQSAASPPRPPPSQPPRQERQEQRKPPGCGQGAVVGAVAGAVAGAGAGGAEEQVEKLLQALEELHEANEVAETAAEAEQLRLRQQAAKAARKAEEAAARAAAAAETRREAALAQARAAEQRLVAREAQLASEQRVQFGRMREEWKEQAERRQAQALEEMRREHAAAVLEIKNTAEAATRQQLKTRRAKWREEKDQAVEEAVEDAVAEAEERVAIEVAEAAESKSKQRERRYEQGMQGAKALISESVERASAEQQAQLEAANARHAREMVLAEACAEERVRAGAEAAEAAAEEVRRREKKQLQIFEKKAVKLAGEVEAGKAALRNAISSANLAAIRLKEEHTAEMAKAKCESEARKEAEAKAALKAVLLVKHTALKKQAEEHAEKTAGRVALLEEKTMQRLEHAAARAKEGMFEKEEAHCVAMKENEEAHAVVLEEAQVAHEKAIADHSSAATVKEEEHMSVLVATEQQHATALAAKEKQHAAAVKSKEAAHAAAMKLFLDAQSGSATAAAKAKEEQHASALSAKEEEHAAAIEAKEEAHEKAVEEAVKAAVGAHRANAVEALEGAVEGAVKQKELQHLSALAAKEKRHEEGMKAKVAAHSAAMKLFLDAQGTGLTAAEQQVKAKEEQHASALSAKEEEHAAAIEAKEEAHEKAVEEAVKAAVDAHSAEAAEELDRKVRETAAAAVRVAQLRAEQQKVAHQKVLALKEATYEALLSKTKKQHGNIMQQVEAIAETMHQKGEEHALAVGEHEATLEAEREESTSRKEAAVAMEERLAAVMSEAETNQEELKAALAAKEAQYTQALAARDAENKLLASKLRKVEQESADAVADSIRAKVRYGGALDELGAAIKEKRDGNEKENEEDGSSSRASSSKLSDGCAKGETKPAPTAKKSPRSPTAMAAVKHARSVQKQAHGNSKKHVALLEGTHSRLRSIYEKLEKL
jgi:hypothetical protein